MKKISKIVMITIVSTLLLAGCGKTNTEQASSVHNSINTTSTQQAGTTGNVSTAQPATELYVNFGDSAYFTMHLYDNDTAKAIARHVGTEDWQLPIYHYNDYENWEIMQYYDVPSRYNIPSDPQNITEEKAGTVYYSKPNRIVLYYGDGEVSAEYTPVGYFDVNDTFINAIENNPVLQGWGNKLIHISAKQK